MAVGCCNATEKIKDNKTNSSEHVFNVVAEYPEKEHIGTEVKQASVHEHGCENSGYRMQRLYGVKGKDKMGNGSIGVYHSPGVHGRRDLHEVDNDVYNNQGNCQVGRNARWIIVFKGNHEDIIAL